MSEVWIRFLSMQNVLQIHQNTLAEEGGAAGVRDEGLLASAIDMPQVSFEGEYLHTNLAEMAAAYLFHICQNHPFVDGNKRIAAFSAVLFLSFNGIPDGELPDQAALERLTIGVASSELTKVEAAQLFRDIGNMRHR